MFGEHVRIWATLVVEAGLDEKQDRSVKPPTGRSLRPKSAGHVWAWIVLAIGTVLCMSITLWVVEAGDTTVVDFSDREVVHRVAGQFKARWPQAPGPPEAYRQKALEQVGLGNLQEALRFTSMALSINPDDLDGWVEMICLSCMRPGDALALGAADRQGLMRALNSIEGSPAGLKTLADLLARGCADSVGISGNSQKATACLNLDHPSLDLKTRRGTLDTLDMSP